MANRAAAYEACNRFIAAHPDSKYIPNVLYIQARTMETRLDEPELLRNARREFYNDFPHVQSEEIWGALLSKRPDSPLAVAAALRLAQLRLRAGKVDQALELLARIDVRGDPTQSADATTKPALRALLRAPPPESSLEFDPEPYLFEAGRLAELIDANRDDPLYGNKPLIDYAALDPRREHYYDQLLTQAARIPQGLLYDNLMAAWAAGRRGVAERHRVLEACIERFAGADSVPRMLYQLAELEIQSLADSDPDSRANGIQRLRQLAERFPATCWGDKARRRVAMLIPASDPAPRPKVPG
jgi:outer membrane protein assembly factor BamD (BamD/ComL family)